MHGLEEGDLVEIPEEYREEYCRGSIDACTGVVCKVTHCPICDIIEVELDSMGGRPGRVVHVSTLEWSERAPRLRLTTEGKLRRRERALKLQTSELDQRSETLIAVRRRLEDISAK